MLHDKVWEKSLRKARYHRGAKAVSTYDIVCIGCLEKRLGRRLTSGDFDFRRLINTADYERSPRLQDRMTPDDE